MIHLCTKRALYKIFTPPELCIHSALQYIIYLYAVFEKGPYALIFNEPCGERKIYIHTQRELPTVVRP